jgi:hypothetical protein
MDWSAVVPVVASLAPMAGSILGGLIPFPGAGLIGQKFGEIIAKQFGLPATATPASVNEAIATAGEETARAKINAAVEQARAEIEGFVDIEKAYLHTIEVCVSETGETMRAEIGHESWFFTGWRPAIGWVFVLFALSFGAMLTAGAAAAAFFSNARPLQILSDAWPIFATYFGTLGLMVGVYIPSRSAEKRAAIENAAPPPNPKLPTTGAAIKPIKR